MMKPVIIIPAFSRSSALHRLLESVNRAYFSESNVKFIVSIDGNGNKDVYEVAEKFVFHHGDYKTIY